MLFLLSPAKSLDYTSAAPAVPETLPEFAADAERLIGVLRRKSPAQLSKLMDISGALATLNAQRFHDWSPKFTPLNARPAVLAFDGDVYDGLRARELPAADLAWAQDHLRMLSGLYGVLRPFDLLQPYRLEMGTALKVGKHDNLYQYWGTRIADCLNRQLAADKTPVVINLASQEYAKAVDRAALRARVIDCVFEEQKADGWRIVGFSAKRARGLMARYAIQQRVQTPRKLEGFQLEGYAFDAAASREDRLVFRRRTAT